MDIRQTITDNIIAMLEKGGNQASPWLKGSSRGMPYNAKTGTAYSGVNVLILWNHAIENSFSSNAWLTYKQADELGGHVRKGEKSVMCVYFEMVKSSKNKANEEVAVYPMCKLFWLFNVAQIDGLPEPKANPRLNENAFCPIDAAERILKKTSADIHYGFEGAFYSPAKDQIFLPFRENFTSLENFYATACHEICHWSGHPSRLDRKFSRRFADLIDTVYHRSIMMTQFIADMGIANSTVGQNFPVEFVDFGTTVSAQQSNAANFSAYYPLNGQTGVKTFMMAESINPFPSIATPSQPISFDAAFGTTLVVTSFTVTQQGSATPLTTATLTHSTDTNNIIPPNEAFVAATSPFATNTTYTVQFVGKVNGTAVTANWSFSTGSI